MSRSHGRVLSRIWQDAEFRALTIGPQRLYLFLLSQDDLNHAGLIPMRLRRWASTSTGLTTDGVLLDLKTLDAARFVLIDEDTEEVLIRTLVRNDNVYRQPKVMIRMGEDARQIVSGRLRAAFAEEMLRLPLHELDGGMQEAKAREVVAAIVSTFGVDTLPRTLPEGYPDDDRPTPRQAVGPIGDESASPQVDTLSEGYPDGYPEGFDQRYAVPPARTRAHSPFPQSPSPDPRPEIIQSPPLDGFLVTPDGATDRAGSLDDQFAEFWAVFPRKVGKQSARKIWDEQRRKSAPPLILAGAIRYRDDPNREDQFTAHPATWLRRGGWDDEPIPARGGTRDQITRNQAFTDPYADFGMPGSDQ